MDRLPQPPRPLIWIGSSRRDYGDFPPRVQETCGFSLFLVQSGQTPLSSKALKGFSASIVELIESFDGDAYRVVYAARFERAVYVLHAFKKKSKQGIKTPQSDIDLIRRRLKDAQADHAARTEQDDGR